MNRSHGLRTWWKHVICGGLVVASLLIDCPAHAAAPAPRDESSSHAERCLAAIDLAIAAAEGGIVDVSFDAMRRATAKGPPVAAVQMGGLLAGGSGRSVRVNSNNSAEQDAATAQAKLAARLVQLHAVWQKQQVDAAQAYQAFKALVLPASRPNEAFAYSVEPPHRQQVYSDVEFDVPLPKPIASGAVVLVDWARLAHQEQDLRDEIARREAFPGTAAAALLIRMKLAEDKDTPPETLATICGQLTGQVKQLVGGSDAELLSGCVFPLLERMDASSPERQKLIDAILQTVSADQQWSSNRWMKYFVAKGLRESIEKGDVEGFRRYAAVSMSRFDNIRSNNTEYVASRESAMYAEAAKRAFAANQIKIAAAALRARSLLPNEHDYFQGHIGDLVDPGQPMVRSLLEMDRAERFALFSDLVWSMPGVGLSTSARINVAESIPAVFAPARSSQPTVWSHVAREHARSVSLLEWTMRDAIALGKQDEIAKRIADLEAKKSDDARLAKFVFALVQGTPDPLALLATTKDGKKSFSPALGEKGKIVPLDIEVAELALAQPDYREAGAKLVTKLLNNASDQHQDQLVTLARDLRNRSRQPAGASPHPLRHWVISDDAEQQRVMAGNPAASRWIHRGSGTWGHETGVDFSLLMLRYPLAGEFTVSVRTLDGNYAEGAASLAGRLFEFHNYQSAVNVGALGGRGMHPIETNLLKKGTFNHIRLVRSSDSLTIQVNDTFEKQLPAAQQDFPFFAMGAYYFRQTSFKELQIEGTPSIPRTVDALTPNLLGWSARFKNLPLPMFAAIDGHSADGAEEKATDESKAYYAWRFADGALESVPTKAANKQNPPPRAARERSITYLRPLCSGERISLEFYHEPGKFSLAPAIGRIAVLLTEPQLPLHWITADALGLTTGIDDSNRVVDPQAELPQAPALKQNDWNQLTAGLEGDVVTLTLNGQVVMRRTWEKEVGRQFSLFHDPSQFQVRVRNVQLTGDWPEQLPSDLFELTGAP